LSILKSKKKSEFISNSILFAILLILSAIFIMPFLWMVTVSVDKTANYSMPFPPSLLPKEFSWINYRIAFKDLPMARYFLNTIYYTVVSVAISAISALLSGYAFSKLEFKGKKFFFIVILGTLMVPWEVTMIPSWNLFRYLGMLNTYWPFFLPSVVYGFGTFLVKQYIDTLPGVLREAAIIDGASEFNIFGRIYLPLCAPITATLVVLLIIRQWNNFLWPLIILSDPAKYLIQIAVAIYVTTETGGQQFPGVNMAITTISVLPILIIFLFMQRYIIESIALSGIKQ